MAKHRKTIGIIGSDSSHVNEFVRIINERKDLDYQVNQVMIENRSDLELSKKRQTETIEKLKNMNIDLVDNIDSLRMADAYMILNLDADLHLDLFKKLSKRNKKIFIDKPITYKIADLEEIIKIDQQKNLVFSSSAFIFSPFTKRIKAKVNEKSRKLIIKGPLYKVDDIPSFHWYGIHLLSILKAIHNEAVSNLVLSKEDNCYIIKAKSGSLEIEIQAFLKDFHDFDIYLINQSEIYYDSLKNDSKLLYEYLLEGIIDFFDYNTIPFTLQDNYEMLLLLDKLNKEEKVI